MLKIVPRALALTVLASGMLCVDARGESLGAVVGLVEDTHGSPVEGAVISLFGKGLGRGVVTLSDQAGRFFLPALPPGSYTLRALGAGHVPAPARQVTVLPNQDSVFTLSLAPILQAAPGMEGGSAEEAAAVVTAEDHTAEERRGLRWLLRHKRRSVLEDRSGLPQGPDPVPAGDVLGGVNDLEGSVEVVSAAASAGEDPEAVRHGAGVVRLSGRLADGASWSVGGLMAEAGERTWRMSGEFLIDAGAGHLLRAGSGYGSRWARGTDGARVDDRSVGVLLVEDQWNVARDVTITGSGRFSYIGYLGEKSHFDPSAAVEYRPTPEARIQAGVSTHTMAPGGDLLTLSTLSTAPTVSWAALDPDLRAERMTRYEVSLGHEKGANLVRAQTFYETVDDRLVNAFQGPEQARQLIISNAPALATRGMAFTLGRRFGRALAGSFTYTFGHNWRTGPGRPDSADLEGDFQDVSARLEASFDSSTRLVAYYRLSRLGAGRPESPVSQQRFDVQLSQGLPFVNGFIRAQCELLVAMRNLFYEVDEGATLDEMAVLDPPRRVLGGVSVRF